MNFTVIDKPTFFGSLGLLLSVTIPLIVWPEMGSVWVNHAREFVVDNFGVAYVALGIGSFLFISCLFWSSSC